MIAKVDAEAAHSKATAEAQGVTSYPTIKFFPAGSTEPVPYEGGRSEADFVSFINGRVGTHRVPGGGLDAVAGTVDTLDTIVAKYTDSAAGSSLSDVAAEARASAAALADTPQAKDAEYYLRVFDRLEKNDGFVAKELARLDGILKKGGLAPAKTDELTKKTNVLRKFVRKPAGKDEL